MKETPKAVAVDSKQLSRAARGGFRAEAIYRFTDRSEPGDPLHLLMIIRMENDQPVLAAATASGKWPSLNLLSNSSVFDLEEPVGPEETDGEVFNRVARLIVP